MIHYTLNTGHSRVSPRGEIAEGVLDRMTDWLRDGDHQLPFPGWSVTTTSHGGGMLFSLHFKSRPVVTCGVALDDVAATEIWNPLESMYLRITELPGHRSADWQIPRRPESLPWLAVVLVEPSDILMTADWIGDFERCMAWGFAERRFEV